MTGADPRTARVATALTFGFNGFLSTTWVAHIPEVKHHLGLSDAALGLALLGPALGALLSMSFAGRASARWGTGRTVSVTMFATYLVIAGPGLAPNLASLFVALLLWGAGTGALDVSMNAQAVEIEAAYGRPIMSSFHAWWSVGSVLGAGAGSLGVSWSVGLAAQQGLFAVVLALASLRLVRRFLPAGEPSERRPGARVFEWRLVLLGLGGLCAMLAEGSSGDWSPVYLRDHLDVAGGQAGLAFVAFTALMTFGRTIGDRVLHVLGRTVAISALAVVGVAGMAIGLIVDTLPMACVGFACLGLGLSVMMPVFLSTGADGPGDPGPKLAVVSSLSYLGFLVGPASIGPVSDAVGVHGALWLLPVFCGLAGIAGVVAVRWTARLHSAV